MKLQLNFVQVLCIWKTTKENKSMKEGKSKLKIEEKKMTMVRVNESK